MMRPRLLSPMRERRSAGRLRIGAVVLLLAAAVGLAAAPDAHALGLLPQCADNVDNDADGSFDFPYDSGCASGGGEGAAPDDTEAGAGPAPRCGDGLDNDGDGKADFPLDPGCTSAGGDNDEGGGAAGPCADTIDNDRDGSVDYPADPGCNWASDTSEVQTACSDGLDNDGDGRIDFPSDLGCTTSQFRSLTGPNDTSEIDPPQCDDGRDNDADGTLDFGELPGQIPDLDCSAATDPSEGSLPQCQDGVDNDGDGKADFPLDLGCALAGDDDETDPPPPPAQCSDGVDNDVDGRLDLLDPGCGNASDNDEADPPAIVLASVAPPLLSPFPVVRVRGSVDQRGTRITLLTVRAPRGAVVALSCRGPGCPLARLTRIAGPKVLRVRRFEGRLRGKATLRIYVTKFGFVGKYTRIQFVRAAAPLRLDRCVSVPGGRTSICPPA